MANDSRPTPEGGHTNQPKDELPPTFINSADEGTDESPLETAGGPDDETRDANPYLGRYRIVGELGSGGFGSVYLAQDESLRRPVAIKVLNRTIRSHDEDRESAILASLRHPAIAEIYDVGIGEDGKRFLVTRFVEGRSLSRVLQQERPDPWKAADWIRQIAEALQVAHSRGITHRDIKPANLMISADGEPVVLDFGVALLDTEVRDHVEYSGTPAWMSPEQAAGRVSEVDGRSDIFSLGSVFYELLTGTRAFRGESPVETLALIQTSEPRPPRQIDPNIPAALEDICLRCLRKSPPERYATAADLAAELTKALEAHSERSSRRTPLIAGVCLAVAVTAIGIGIALTRGDKAADSGAKQAAANSENQEVLSALSTILGRLEQKDALRRAGIEVANDAGDGQKTHTATEQPAGTPSPVSLPAGFAQRQQQLDEAVGKKDLKEESSVLLKVTNEMLDEGHYAIAEQAARRMVFVSKDDAASFPIACGQLGVALYKRGKFDEAIKQLQVSADQYSKLYDRMMAAPDSAQVEEFRSHMARLLGITWMRMGNAHKFAERFDDADKRYRDALQLFEKHKRSGELQTLLLNYGSMESQRGNALTAITLLTQGLEIATRADDHKTRAEFMINLANAQSRSGDNDAAISTYAEAEKLAAQHDDYELKSKLHLNYAKCLLESDRSEEARGQLKALKAMARPGDEDAAEALLLLDLIPDKQTR